MSYQKACSVALKSIQKQYPDLKAIDLEYFVLGFTAAHKTIVHLKTLKGELAYGLFIKQYDINYSLYLIDSSIALVYDKTLEITRSLDISDLFHVSKHAVVRLEELDISIRCYQTLKHNNITMLSDLLDKPFDEIRAFRLMSRNTLQEIEELILKYNLK